MIALDEGNGFIDVSAYKTRSLLGQEQAPDPMANVANLVDVMLVLACGLMLALVTFWNIDFPTITQIKEEELVAADDVEKINQDIEATGTTYSELGTVYEDSETGKKYMIVEGDAEGGSSGE